MNDATATALRDLLVAVERRAFAEKAGELTPDQLEAARKEIETAAKKAREVLYEEAPEA